MYRVHHFASSQEAYEASLDEGTVREDDILVIAAEGVVGLASTDPVAITAASGALKAFPSMGRDMLLAELVHDAVAIGRAVDEALRHLLLSSEVRRTMTQGDIMVTTDALDRRIAGLGERAATVDPDRSEGLFLAQALRQLAGARERLGNPPRPNR